MGKMWNGHKRMIHVRARERDRKTADFIANDAICLSPINIFLLDGREVYRYDERTHYYYCDSNGTTDYPMLLE